MAATMDGLGTLAAGLAPNVYPWPVESVNVPCVLIDYPSTIEFDTVFARGGDRVEHPVWFITGTTSNKSARDAMSAILADTSSVKSALDGSHSFGDVRVTGADVSKVTIGGIDYIGVKFTAEVYT